MSNAYPISAPIDFVNTTPGVDILNFQAQDNASGNLIQDFVTTTLGDLIYQGASGFLERIAIGTAGQQLTVVAGIPTWSTPAVSANTMFSATVTASVVAFPASATWATLTGAVLAGQVTWSTAAPNHNAGAIFTTGTGVLLIPVGGAGVWDLSASVTFEGNNSGTAGLIGATRATRQMRIRRTNNTAVTLGLGQMQASAFNGNPTMVTLASVKPTLGDGDTIVVQVRHDASVDLNIVFDENASTFFNAQKVTA
jgi:hypothetical protein